MTQSLTIKNEKPTHTTKCHFETIFCSFSKVHFIYYVHIKFELIGVLFLTIFQCFYWLMASSGRELPLQINKNAEKLAKNGHQFKFVYGSLNEMYFNNFVSLLQKACRQKSGLIRPGFDKEKRIKLKSTYSIWESQYLRLSCHLQ